MLELAADWRKLDAEAMARHFAPNLDASTWPEAMGPPRGQLVGVIRHAAPKLRKSAPSIEVARNLIAFAKAHGEVKHISLKPVGADLAYPVKFTIIGELPDGRRIWSKGRAFFRDADGKIDSIYLRDLKTLASRRRIFRDVGLPGTDPAVLDHPTLGLAAYGAAAVDANGDGKHRRLLHRARRQPACTSTPASGKFRTVSGRRRRRTRRPRALFLDVRQRRRSRTSSAPPTARRCCWRTAAGPVRRHLEGGGCRGQVDRVLHRRPATSTATASPTSTSRRTTTTGPVAPASWVDGRTTGCANLLFLSARATRTLRRGARRRWGVAGQASGATPAQFLRRRPATGKLDLYVASDFGAGMGLFLRRGDRFVDRARRSAGVFDGGYGMGVFFGDVRQRRPDLDLLPHEDVEFQGGHADPRAARGGSGELRGARVAATRSTGRSAPATSRTRCSAFPGGLGLGRRVHRHRQRRLRARPATRRTGTCPARAAEATREASSGPRSWQSKLDRGRRRATRASARSSGRHLEAAAEQTTRSPATSATSSTSTSAASAGSATSPACPARTRCATVAAAVYFDFDDDGDLGSSSCDPDPRALGATGCSATRSDTTNNWIRVSSSRARASGKDAFGTRWCGSRRARANPIHALEGRAASRFLSRRATPGCCSGIGNATSEVAWLEVTWPGGTEAEASPDRRRERTRDCESSRSAWRIDQNRRMRSGLLLLEPRDPGRADHAGSAEAAT